MSGALSVFEKYIGKANYSNLPLANITDTNQIIGALQTIDKCLKNCLSKLGNPEDMDALISSCSFMGENLFEKEIHICPIQKSFCVYNIFSLLQNNQQEEIALFISKKREEISQLLDLIFDFLDCEDEQPLSSCNTTHASMFKEFF